MLRLNEPTKTVWNLPADFNGWSMEKKVQWHKKRVKLEMPLFLQLEEQGMLVRFTGNEVEIRLQKIEEYRTHVREALYVDASAEFRELWKRLNLICLEIRDLDRESDEIRAVRVRRSNFTLKPKERAKFQELKLRTLQACKQAEKYEGLIMDFCEKYETDPTPYLLLDEIRGGQ